MTFFFLVFCFLFGRPSTSFVLQIFNSFGHLHAQYVRNQWQSHSLLLLHRNLYLWIVVSSWTVHVSSKLWNIVSTEFKSNANTIQIIYYCESCFLSTKFSYIAVHKLHEQHTFCTVLFFLFSSIVYARASFNIRLCLLKRNIYFADSMCDQFIRFEEVKS